MVDAQPPTPTEPSPNDRASGVDRSSSLSSPHPKDARSRNSSSRDFTSFRSANSASKGQKMRHRKVKQGETIYKGHPSWNLMLNIKLGISYTVGRITPERQRALIAEDFSHEFKQEFPPEGSARTPAHGAGPFIFKYHAPFAFRHLREHFGVTAQDYMMSLCSEDSLRELSTPGKSGAVFYLSHDDNFIIKTISKKESKFLRQVLPQYYTYCMHHKDSLIPRFFGLIRVKTERKRNIRMVVMNNLLPNYIAIHERFDLKGSTFGRTASEEEKTDPNVTLKDLDWSGKLTMSPELSVGFLSQLEKDTNWLESLRIMDYSLLMGIHYPSRHDADESMEATLLMSNLRTPFSEVVGKLPTSNPNKSKESTVRSNLTADQGFTTSTPTSSNSSTTDGGSTITGGGTADEFIFMPSNQELTEAHQAALQLRERTAEYTAIQQAHGGLMCFKTDAQEDVVVFLGMIDILQQYGTRKKLEHKYKAIRFARDKDGISVVNPSQYASRFRKFLTSNVFNASSADATDGVSNLANSGAMVSDVAE